MSNSRCIVVLSVPRSGSSAVAGVLQKLGVDMGHDHIGPHASNPKGHFEDEAFVALNDQVIGRDGGSWMAPNLDPPTLEQARAYAQLIEERAAKPLWGIKDPRLCLTLRWFLPDLLANCDVRLIDLERDFVSSVSSLAERDHLTHIEATEILGYYYQGQTDLSVIMAMSREIYTDSPVSQISCILHLNYGGLLADSQLWVSRIVDLLWDDMEIINQDDAFFDDRSRRIDDAVAFIDPTLNHHGAFDATL